MRRAICGGVFASAVVSLVCGVAAPRAQAPAPETVTADTKPLTELQQLQVKNALLALENAQLHLEAAQRELEDARTAATAVLAHVCPSGYHTVLSGAAADPSVATCVKTPAPKSGGQS